MQGIRKGKRSEKMDRTAKYIFHLMNGTLDVYYETKARTGGYYRTRTDKQKISEKLNIFGRRD